MSYAYLFVVFPNLIVEGFTPTSKATSDYNCIAWAAHDEENWWWPFGKAPNSDKEAYWPRMAPNKETVKAFIRAFEAKGYKRIAENDRSLEDGFEKIAIYALGTRPTHAARQLSDGNWTHKLGPDIDVTASLMGISGTEYGNVVCIMKRKSK